MRTVVIGLDGANWSLIEHWIESGDLPNLKYLRENGSWGVSKSQLPAVTCPNWKCYSTGKNPAKLGVFWWQRVDCERKKLVGYNSKSFDSLEIFDYISRAGFRVGVINMPTTYPPKEVNGFMISGAPDSGYTNYTYPKSLEKELKERYDYRVYPKVHISNRSDIEEYFDEILSVIDLRFKVAKDFLKYVDFLHVSIFYINVLHHFFFDEDYVREAWKLIDSRIGNFIDNDEVSYIFLMSDHGTNEIYETFFVNTWLEKEGYLKTRKPLTKNLAKFGITKQNLVRITNKIGLTNLIKRMLPEEIIRSVPSEDGTASGTRILDTHIDWEKSKAVAVGQGLIYLLVDRDSDEYEKLREEIVFKLSRVKTPNGYKVTKKIYKKEEVYKGKYLDIAPDIVYEEGDHVYTSSGIGKDKIFDTANNKWRAENNRDGIFLAYGENIKRGKKLEGVEIIDIAPTILYLLGIPVPKDMDGKVLIEIFEDELKAREVTYTEAFDEKEKISRKIKELKLGKI